MRLDHYLARMLGATRKDARAWIKRRRVQVNGEAVAVPSTQIVAGTDRVTVDGDDLPWREHITIMLHKPKGVITATRDRHHRTVIELIPRQQFPRIAQLVPVGRLDKDTTGLLLLTTHGALVQRLTHPRHHLPKTYLAHIEGRLDAMSETSFADGLVLRDGTRCEPATLERLDSARVRVTLHEGKYHQVKRMLAACGATVIDLHRPTFGPLELGNLPLGRWRVLEPDELRLLAPP